MWHSQDECNKNKGLLCFLVKILHSDKHTVYRWKSSLREQPRKHKMHCTHELTKLLLHWNFFQWWLISTSLKNNIPHSCELQVKYSRKYSLNGWGLTVNSEHTTAYFQQIIWFLSPVHCSVSFMYPKQAIPTCKKQEIIWCTEARIIMYSMSRGYGKLKECVMVMIPLHYSLVPQTDLEMWLAQEIIPVCQKLGSLAQLSCQWVDEVRHKACVVVVSLQEIFLNAIHSYINCSYRTLPWIFWSLKQCYAIIQLKSSFKKEKQLSYGAP